MSTANITKIPHRCVLKIQAVYDTLKSAEKKAVDLILDKPEEIANSTINEFSDMAGCSEATIVRVAKRLGYKGFPELKADFAENIKSEQYLEYEEINKTDDPFTIVKKVFDSSIAAINNTLDIINKKEYEKALNALLGADKIMFCGIGDAALVAMEAHQRFIRIGQNSLFSHDPDIQLIYSSQLKKGDALVAISYSGRSKTVIETVKTAKNSGSVIIAVTNFPVSPLAKRSDILLLTAAFSKYMTGEIISKRVAELCIVESLYINYLLKKGDNVMDILRKSNDVISINKL
jgi:DNA-binding MurR/RpiR family transcriptional regulator